MWRNGNIDRRFATASNHEIGNALADGFDRSICPALSVGRSAKIDNVAGTDSRKFRSGVRSHVHRASFTGRREDGRPRYARASKKHVVRPQKRAGETQGEKPDGT